MCASTCAHQVELQDNQTSGTTPLLTAVPEANGPLGQRTLSNTSPDYNMFSSCMAFHRQDSSSEYSTSSTTRSKDGTRALASHKRCTTLHVAIARCRST
eukprot:6321894-Amphidinium_carterae.1